MKNLVPTATLCFLLLVFAAQGKVDDTADPEAILFIHGRAQCESDPSRIISRKKNYAPEANNIVNFVIKSNTIPQQPVRYIKLYMFCYIYICRYCLETGDRR